MDRYSRSVMSLGPAYYSGRDVWMPRFDYEPVEVMGTDPWPKSVLVTMWEENGIGERRYVATRTYRFTEPTTEV